MAADYGRIHRLLKILTLIQGSSGWTPRRLAQECDTTERTIFRDLKMLEGAGIPYFYDREKKTYCVRRDFFLPPVQMTLDEALALTALAEQIGGREQIPYTDAAARGIAKLRGQLPVSIRQELEKIEANVAIHLAASNPPEAAADVYATVRFALAQRLALRCAYESMTNGRENGRHGDGELFVFKPYALFFGQRAWYVIGHHDGRAEVRCLKLTRFTRIELTQQHYSIPKHFSLSNHLGNAWRMIRGGKRYEVELRFDAEFADTIADTHWHHSQEIAWHDDDSITFRCTVDGLEEIVWWILSMGPHCEVKRPRELIDRVRELAAETCTLYPPDKTAGKGRRLPSGKRG